MTDITIVGWCGIFLGLGGIIVFSGILCAVRDAVALLEAVHRELREKNDA